MRSDSPKTLCAFGLVVVVCRGNATEATFPKSQAPLSESEQSRSQKTPKSDRNKMSKFQSLSDPLDWLNAILSLLHPLDRYRARSAIGSAIGRPLSRPISHPNTGGSPQPPRFKPLGGLNRTIVVLKCPKLRLQSPYTGASTPPNPEIPKKSQKGVPGPPRPECQKSVEKVP